jgi:hypothetical protein
MNKIKKIIALLLPVMLSAACDDLLDPEIGLPGLQAEKDVIYSYNRTVESVNALYTYLPDGLFYIGSKAMLAAASDEAEFTIETNAVQKFNTGSWNAVNNPDPAWKNNFEGIYAVNLLLQNADSVDLDYLKNDPNAEAQKQYQAYLNNLDTLKYEARFLRAYFYFELVKRYGGVPLIDTHLSQDADFSAFPRNTLDSCTQFILNECDSVASVLPGRYQDNAKYGRVTKITALALKSRLLLYMASDLFNDPSWAGAYDHPELISLTAAKTREERWTEAAMAAATAIVEADKADHGLHTGYEALFRTFDSREYILARRYGSGNDFEKINYPVGYNGAEGGLTPLGNLVDAYEYLDGSMPETFDWNNPIHAANPFDSRDARMKASIVFNNSMFNGGRGEGLSRPVEIWQGGLDGLGGVARSTRTGYYLKKFVDENLDLIKGQAGSHTFPLIRYAELLLNYAEAVNEIHGPNTIVPGAPDDLTYTALRAMNKVRERAPIRPIYTMRDKDQMRDLIRHERRVELAFEDHRLWDVRRWKTAPDVLGSPATGVDITKNEDGTFVYKPVEVEKRKWEDKMYFYPIPQKELGMTRWPQNPLW